MHPVGIEFYGKGEAKISGTGSITFGHLLSFESIGGGEKSLNYRPELKFDGVVATVVVKADVGLTIKKGWFSGTDFNHTLADFNGKYNLVDGFDFIKKIEGALGVNATIPLIKS